jgi:hypothetical protein
VPVAAFWLIEDPAVNPTRLALPELIPICHQPVPSPVLGTTDRISLPHESFHLLLESRTIG